MAQRAYRHRKEATIEDLRKRVSDLQATIEVMNRATHQFGERAATAGIPAELGADLSLLLRQCERLTSSSRNPDDQAGGRDELLQNLSAVAVDPRKRGSSPSASETTTDKPHGEDVVIDQVPIGLGYSIVMDQQQDDQVEVLPDRITPDSLWSNDWAPKSDKSPPAHQLTAMPLLRTASLKSPQTYSFQESSFGRRLHRRCLEGGYQYVTLTMTAFGLLTSVDLCVIQIGTVKPTTASFDLLRN